MKSLILSADHWITALCHALASLLLAGIACLGMWQVTSRFVLSQPTTWTEESMRRLLVWMVMLGVVVAVRKGALVSVDLMLRLSSGAWRRVVRGVITGAHLSFFTVLVWFGMDLVWRVRFQTFASMELSMAWAYAAMPVGAILGIVATLAHHLDPQNEELASAQ
jgi:TRAP-type C4-dicarboxylate transport system permease small subunit